ncbi:double-strand-break repair protein rad21 homolog [Argiope bruennichi]|uniref:Double-strand-break repair protein rad21 like protein n=1 Tax=Argiope bruennichi TaxID=94029 RepID=A0A8T0FEV2_ARGBR|nr:double-strand-break repair protein rad21 homolog [Argiope bruennichi]KAF8789606.1 Double-strand-break repair protein rad21 like protein [Argiope bruennichi]
MFYAHFVLAKKGPLARIWLAAHWDKKLTKAHVFETNIESSVEGILQPKVKMALRTSGHLLLGIVRIYSRKAKYLLADCNEAFIKIKIAFRPGVVDLPEGNREAAVAAITLPEVFHDFDTALPDITIDMDAQVSLNQSRAEDITLKEDYGNLSLMADDGFDDMGFEEPEAARDATNMEDGFDDASLLLCEDPSQERPDESAPGVSNASIVSKPKLSLDAPLKDDGFGGTVGEGLLDGETGGLFEPAGLFDDAPLGPVELDNTATEPTVNENIEQPLEKPIEQHAEDDSDDDMYDMAPGSMGAPSPPSSPESPGPPLNTDGNAPEPESRVTDLEPREENPLDPLPRGPDPASDPIQDMPPPPPPEEMPPPPVPHIPALDHTTLINNDAESFALAPLDATIVHGAERTVKAKRKRKLVVDEVKSISGEEMKSQLSDTTDIVATLDLAPPTKRLMHWKETGGVEKLFSLPGHRILSKTLTRAYLRHLTTRSVENEVYGNDDEQDELDSEIEKGRDEDASVGSSKRRRLMESELPHDLSHLDSFHLDSSRPSYPNEPSLPRASFTNEPNLSHPSLDVPNFMPPQHHLFPPNYDQQMMPPQVMQHGHMVLQPDLHQLPHIPQMMDSMVNQGPSLQSITPSIHSDALPGVTDSVHHSVIEPVSQHLHPNAMAPEHLQQQQQLSMDKQLPPHPNLNDPLNQQMLQNQLQPNTNDFIPHNENGAHPDTEQNPPPAINGQMPQHNIDDDATQPLLDQYPQTQERHEANSSAPSELLQNDVAAAPAVDKQAEEPALQNGIDQPTTDAQSASNLLFDSLIGDMQTQPQQQNTSTLNESSDMQMPQDKQNEFMGSDDEDDYGAPASVGPIMPDEQMADETYEQFEERILTKRTTHLLHVIHNALDNNRSISFSELVKNNKRKQVAQKFYTFLVLKKQQAVELEQNPSYGDMIITRGPKYNAVYNGN